jgi:adenylate kinase
MGPPGAGKGTQGELLAQHFGIPRYSTGDILRDARRSTTELGLEAQRYMDAGELVPDAVILGIVEQVMSEPEAAGGFLCDGFPRTVAQARGLAEVLARDDLALDAVLNLTVGVGEIVSRLTRRAGLEGRTDDDLQTVRRRLEVYEEQTAPVLEYYRESPVGVTNVDGTGTVDEIQARLRERLSA